MSNLVWAEHLRKCASVDGKALIKEQPAKLSLGNSQPGDLNSKMHLQVTSVEWFLVLSAQEVWIPVYQTLVHTQLKEHVCVNLLIYYWLCWALAAA